MKRWRRTASVSFSPPPPAPSGPVITSVRVGFAGAAWIVTWSVPVDCSLSNADTFHTSDGGVLSGSGNLSPTEWEVDSDIVCVPGITWTYDPADVLLSPIPPAPQTGTTVA